MIKQKSTTQDLASYLKKNLKKGYTKESLKWALIDQGYSKIEIDKAIKAADKEMADEAPVLKTKPEIEYEVVDSEGEKPKTKAKKKGVIGFIKKYFSNSA